MRLKIPASLVLDTGPLGLVTAPPSHSKGKIFQNWFFTLESAGCDFFVPEIADFELRRELIRARKWGSIQKLDEFNAAEVDRYLPLITADVKLAAQFWADARNSNKAGASKDALDGDTLIAAQAERLQTTLPGREVVVATTNPSHLIALTEAELWSDIIL